MMPTLHCRRCCCTGFQFQQQQQVHVHRLAVGGGSSRWHGETANPRFILTVLIFFFLSGRRCRYVLSRLRTRILLHSLALLYQPLALSLPPLSLFLNFLSSCSLRDPPSGRRERDGATLGCGIKEREREICAEERDEITGWQEDWFVVVVGDSRSLIRRKFAACKIPQTRSPSLSPQILPLCLPVSLSLLSSARLALWRNVLLITPIGPQDRSLTRWPNLLIGQKEHSLSSRSTASAHDTSVDDTEVGKHGAASLGASLS